MEFRFCGWVFVFKFLFVYVIFNYVEVSASIWSKIICHHAGSQHSWKRPTSLPFQGESSSLSSSLIIQMLQASAYMNFTIWSQQVLYNSSHSPLKWGQKGNTCWRFVRLFEWVGFLCVWVCLFVFVFWNNFWWMLGSLVKKKAQMLVIH